MNSPFLLMPAAKDYLWGGRKLNDEFGKNIPLTPLAETWECSTHPDGPSVVQKEGRTLSDVLHDHPEYLGTHPLKMTEGKPELPILIKFIDAKKDLSVQVHPDDAYAMKREGQWGKTEFWYVLSAQKDAQLIYGFKQDVSREQIEHAVKDGSIDSLLNHVPVEPNDIFLIRAGTVHAIGKGCLIAEIQQSSNLTYRLYDYDRTDKYGQKRPLHLKQALEVADCHSSLAPRQPMRVLKYRSGCASELLCRCRYFQIERLLLNTETERNLVLFQTGSNSFHALLCIEGCGSMSWDKESMNFFKGDCIFVPADSAELKLHGKAQFLNVSC